MHKPKKTGIGHNKLFGKIFSFSAFEKYDLNSFSYIHFPVSNIK